MSEGERSEMSGGISPERQTAAIAREEPEIEVSAETMRQLQAIARKLDCNVEAALEEVVREFTP